MRRVYVQCFVSAMSLTVVWGTLMDMAHYLRTVVWGT